LSIKISLYLLLPTKSSVADKKTGRGSPAAGRPFHAQISAKSASDEFVKGGVTLAWLV
jgi:hypothetical protein